MSTNTSDIYYSLSNNRLDFVEKILARFEEEITGKILIKVNLVSYEPYPTTTHTKMLEAVLKLLKGRDITVGDAYGVDLGKYDVEQSNLYAICEKFKVPFIDFYQLEMQSLKSERGFELTLSKYPFQCDYIISLPILKIHQECSLTGALKNAFGYLAKRDRIHMHMQKKDIHQGVAELNTVIKPNLTIMDAIDTLIKANEVRHGGKKRNLSYLLGGKDPLALDVFGFSLLKKLDPNWKPNSALEIPHLRYAKEFGVGNSDFQLIEV